MNRPLPDLQDPEFAEHWTGLSEGRLRIRRCLACGQHAWPPRPACVACHSLEQEWAEVAPQAIVFSWTIVGHATLPGFEPPYAVVLGELVEPAGVRLLGAYHGEHADLRVGLALTAEATQVSDETYLLTWVSAEPSPKGDTDNVVDRTDQDTESG